MQGKDEVEDEYRLLCEPVIRAICEQRDAVHFFPGYEIPDVAQALDRTCGDGEGAWLVGCGRQPAYYG